MVVIKLIKKIKRFKVKLSKSLKNFHKSENITVEIEDNGKSTHKLNNNIKEIDSIQSEGLQRTKISFTSTNPSSNGVKDKIEFTLGNTNGGVATKFTFSEAGLDLGNK